MCVCVLVYCTGGAYGSLTFFDLIAGKWVPQDRDTEVPAVLRSGPARWPEPSPEQLIVQNQLQ